MALVESTLELVGRTPMVRLRRIAGAHAGLADIACKLEGQNPGGSVKDRVCLAMIEAAERDGRLRPGDTIVEPTSGNTGIGLALVAAVKGYRLILCMPDDASSERRALLAHYGAEVVLTPARKLMKEHQVPVVMEFILERVTNIAMGTEIQNVNEFEEIMCLDPSLAIDRVSGSILNTGGAESAEPNAAPPAAAR